MIRCSRPLTVCILVSCASLLAVPSLAWDGNSPLIIDHTSTNLAAIPILVKECAI